ncbi:polyphosphate kinase 1 [Nitrosomonas sp. ANs5]|uniref:polyphosphate kinase 1 n=1 Tax=Nitrosomonas sp. ANs5 TaxID=3423941 RepID=UPI003D34C07A
MADNESSLIATNKSDIPIPKQFLNRELSQIEFNRRVLAQAENEQVPLLERLRFICIVSNNFDEFFEVRVAGLKEQIKLDSPGFGPDGMAPSQAFNLVSDRAHQVVARQYHLFNDSILPALAKQGIQFLRRHTWSDAQREWIKSFFFRELMPMLTPIGLDPSHPFPRVLNKSLNFAVELEGKDAFGRNSGIAIVQAPRILPRVIRLPKEVSKDPYSFVFLSSIIHAHVGELFTGMHVVGCYQFRVTRNSNLFVDEEEIKNLRIALQGELPQRHLGDAVRLEVADNCSQHMAEFLLEQFSLKDVDLFQVNGPVNLVRLIQVSDLIDRPELKFPKFIPGLPFLSQKKKANNIFQVIRKGDILLHHPYQSFQPVIEFIQQASIDPDVVAVKQTVYRTGSDSTLMEALIAAASMGKEVTVVVELLARFDEEANINWAGRLEEVGAHVVYGIVGHKTHSKMAMVVRREAGQLKRYAHLGTGNYHPGTARLYTDFGLLTCHEEICADVNEVFLQLTGLGKASKLKHLWQSPFSLHNQILNSIQQEIEYANKGKPAAIIAKMNALLEPVVIQALYAASRAGVKINLIVRGACALRPGVPGLSENIRVRSIIGRFLEHSRIFYFHNNNHPNVYLASADWMDRNFFRRVEVCFPVLDSRLKKRIITEGLKPYLRDNVQAWEMNGEGDYKHKSARRSRRYCAQEDLLAKLAAVKQDSIE